MPDIDRLKRIANTAFIREQQKADAPAAMAEYHAKQLALRERTRQLREQRLAREARARKERDGQRQARSA